MSKFKKFFAPEPFLVYVQILNKIVI